MLSVEATYAIAETCSCLHVQAADDRATLSMTRPPARASSAN